MVLTILRWYQNNMIQRRSFLQATVASLALGSCANPPPLIKKLPEPSQVQKSARRLAPSSVGILRAKSYADDLFAILKENIDLFNTADFKGKFLILKPNMVECPAGKPVTTSPEVLKAVIKLVDYLGAAKIAVAEGPGHMRDTEAILAATGIGKACGEMAVPFIDLNLDDVIKVPIKESFAEVDHYFLPKTILEADGLISLPKLKTHHWVGMTAAMKNLFGLVPGRKYGYPKNFLHFKGIPQCILDLNRLVQTKLSVVDAIVAMEGDGPINGTPREMGLMIVGQDPAAVDATCARIIGFEIDELNYIQAAGQVIGNVDQSEIKLTGVPLDEVKTQFKRPITYLKDKQLSAKLLYESERSAGS